MENDLFVLTDENGIDNEFYKIGEFESIKTNKNYIVYTDKKYTNDKLNIYCSILTEENGNIKFNNLENEDDRQEFEKALIEFQKLAMQSTTE